jgi:hypothetical protein
MTERGTSDSGEDGASTPSETLTKTRAKTASASAKKRSRGKEEGHVSQALRTVYQRAIDEDIPSEMLDLLKKLD